MIDELVRWYCCWCWVENEAPRGQCRCRACGQPRGSQPPDFFEPMKLLDH